ncbi:DUF6541 family protein [Humibacter albus]|uniref:DUF6541 family protein n=1 Tax=Humibacter albus TaxID=427754 RepID=UPI0003B47690|nr:DUF6541 family protein [Humibacter albus]
MSWWVIVPAAIAAGAIVLIPGLVIAYSATARGVTAWGLAPLLSMTVFVVLSLGLGVAHLPFTAVTAAVGTAVIVAVTAIVLVLVLRRRGVRPLHTDRPWINAMILVTVVIALITFSIRFASALVHPDAISQTFDDVFHLNGVRYIIDTHDANPLTFINLDAAFGGPGGFYPNLWHVLASLTALYSGASIPVALNALNIVICGVIWPLGCVLLVRSLVGPRLVALLATGILSASFGAFPMLLVTYGVLYPNLLGLAALPAALGILVFATRLATKPTLVPVLAWIAFIATIPGIAMAHPNAFVSLLVVGFPLMFAFGWRWFKDARAEGASRARLTRGAVITAVIAVVGLVLFIVLRPPRSTATWGPSKGLWDAIWSAITNGQDNAAQWAVSILVLVGVAAVFVARRNWWLVGSLALVWFFYVATAIMREGGWRFAVTGTWYSDIHRLVALGPVVLVPLAVIGVQWLADLAASLGAVLAGRRAQPALDVDADRAAIPGDEDAAASGRRWPVVFGTAFGLVVILVAAVVAQVGPGLASMSGWTGASFAQVPNSWLLSSDERALIDRVPNEVPKDAVVAGDPWTGASLVWALADRRTLAPHIYGARTPAANLILARLRHATPGSKVCAALKKENVTYALDFGSNGLFGPKRINKGMNGLSASPVLTLIDQQGPAKLYKVTGCD